MAILRGTISKRESSRGSPSESCYLNAITPNVPAKIIIGASGEEKPVDGAIARRSSTKFNSPKLVNVNRLAVGVLDRAHELTRYAVKGVDATGVGVVGD